MQSGKDSIRCLVSLMLSWETERHPIASCYCWDPLSVNGQLSSEVWHCGAEVSRPFSQLASSEVHSQRLIADLQKRESLQMSLVEQWMSSGDHTLDLKISCYFVCFRCFQVLLHDFTQVSRNPLCACRPDLQSACYRGCSYAICIRPRSTPVQTKLTSLMQLWRVMATRAQSRIASVAKWSQVKLVTSCKARAVALAQELDELV